MSLILYSIIMTIKDFKYKINELVSSEANLLEIRDYLIVAKDAGLTKTDMYREILMILERDDPSEAAFEKFQEVGDILVDWCSPGLRI